MTSRTPLWQRAAAGAGLIVLTPVLGAAAILIKKSDPGPVFYRADRAGVGGQRFVMYKLRTMRHRTDAQGSITAAGDHRIIPGGRLLRKLKLDEIPQLANVVTGEMALVGPRPEARNIVDNHYQPWMMETLEVPPGITGPGSLHYIDQERAMRSNPDESLAVYVREVLPRKLAYDLVYVRHRSTSYELRLVVRTVLSVLQRRSNESGVAAEWERIEAEHILAKVTGRTVRPEMKP